MFDIPLFSQLLERAPSVLSEKEVMDNLLSTYQESEGERKERERLILICHDIMRAENYEDVEVSLEDLVKLATVYEDVRSLYCESNSGTNFYNYKKRLGEARSLKVRRVL